MILQCLGEMQIELNHCVHVIFGGIAIDIGVPEDKPTDIMWYPVSINRGLSMGEIIQRFLTVCKLVIM